MFLGVDSQKTLAEHSRLVKKCDLMLSCKVGLIPAVVNHKNWFLGFRSTMDRYLPQVVLKLYIQLRRNFG